MTNSDPALYNVIGGYVGIAMMVYHVVCVLGYLYYSTQVKYPYAKNYKLFGIFPHTLILRSERSWPWVSLVNAVLTPVWFPLMLFLWLPFLLIAPLGAAVHTARQKKFK